MRLFFAIPISDAMRTQVIDVMDEMRLRIKAPGVRWVTPDQFHFTLKFLGETPPDRVRSACEAATVASRAMAPFELRVGGVGAFPNDRRPTVLWVGVTAGMGPMTDLALALDTALHMEGFRREKVALKAHLTLARVKSYAGEAAAAQYLRHAEVGDLGGVTVDRFLLMESTLRAGGAEYQVVDEFPLCG